MTFQASLHSVAHSPRARRNAAIVAVVAAAHLALLILPNQWRAPAAAPVAKGVPVWLVAGANFPSFNQAKLLSPPKAHLIVTPRTIQAPALKLKVAEPLKISSETPTIQIDPTPAKPAPSTSVPPAQSAPPAGGPSGGRRCDIFSVVQSALQTSQPVRAAIAAIPAKARSVANAILIWDGRWADPASMGGPAALDPIEKTVLDSVASAPQECQGDVVAGPRLITVSDQHNTTILAFGSGAWKWSDLSATVMRP